MTGPQNPPPAAYAPTQPQFYIRRAKPTYTRILIGLNLAMFIITTIVGYINFETLNGSQDLRVLVTMGAKYNPAIAEGEYWRLLSAMFLHIGIFHLLINLYALNAIGPMVEGYFGHWRFLAIYLVGGLFGSLASYAFSPAISAGASGAIFGLLGAVTVYFLKYKDNFGAQGRAILQNMAVILVINLIFGLTASGIDNWGHMGGLVGGALVAWGLLPRYQTPSVVRIGPQELEQEVRTTSEVMWVFVAIGLLVAGVIAVTNMGPPTFQ